MPSWRSSSPVPMTGPGTGLLLNAMSPPALRSLSHPLRFAAVVERSRSVNS